MTLNDRSGPAARGPRRVAIDRREGIDLQELAAHYMESSVPLIMAGRVASWPAVGKWTPEHIRARYPGVIVSAAVDLPAESVPYFERHVDHARDLPMTAFVDLLRSGDRKLACYAHQVSFDDLPDLRADTDFAGITPVTRTSKVTTNIWIGSAGTRSGLHYDGTDNFLVQVYGRKKLALVPPGQFREVYPFTWNFSKSPVDPNAPDLVKYPKFADATVWEGEIGPGDVLFIPATWWHFVTSLEPSISINQWFGGSKQSTKQWYQRMTASGPSYWAEFLRQVAVHGVLGRRYDRRLFGAPPPGVRRYEELRGTVRATLRQIAGRRAQP
jgi:lysine-specific demethylase 8